jgi:hypothetical protein
VGLGDRDARQGVRGTGRCRLRATVRVSLGLRQMAIISQLPGKAFELWLLIRYRTDLTGKSEITLPSELLKEWGIRRDAKADGLRRLVEAGEIKIEHQQGHSTKVKLINARKNRRQR